MLGNVQHFTMDKPWFLSKKDRRFVILKDNMKYLKNYDILTIDFLFQTYMKQFKGVIINEENGFVMQLQISVFLNVLLNCVNKKNLILVLCPDNLLVNWHYHLSVNGQFKIKIINSTTCSEDFDEKHGMVLLLTFSNIKLAEALIDYKFLSVVIDSFDQIATKLIIRKLHGDFNIGLTRRDFYQEPDQKLQWSMLNWSNPGCLGKLAEFYKIDNDNFVNFRDNYRHWWFRLTWNFCETFHKYTEKEEEDYLDTLQQWKKQHNIWTNIKIQRKQRKRTKDETHIEIIKKEKSQVETTSIKKSFQNASTFVEKNINTDNVSSEKDQTDLEEDANPELPTTSKSESGDILLSLINNSALCITETDYETHITCKKEEILSQIFEGTSKTSVPSPQDHSFLLSLVDSRPCEKRTKIEFLLDI